VENTKTQDAEQKIEMVHVADADMLVGTAVRRGRGRPPGSTNRSKTNGNGLIHEPETGTNGTAAKSNGRAGRPAKAEKGVPGKVNADKPIYTLSVAAEILELHPRTLRIYEEHELVVPYRTVTQRRRYSQNDIRKFQFIQFLTQRRRVNLEGVKIILLMLDMLRDRGVAEPIRFVFEDYQEVD
jgi:hypothetical protein